MEKAPYLELCVSHFFLVCNLYSLPHRGPVTTEAGDILRIFIFQRKEDLAFHVNNLAKQTVCMKCQALFSEKKKWNKVCLLSALLMVILGLISSQNETQSFG